MGDSEAQSAERLFCRLRCLIGGTDSGSGTPPSLRHITYKAARLPFLLLLLLLPALIIGTYTEQFQLVKMYGKQMIVQAGVDSNA